MFEHPGTGNKRSHVIMPTDVHHCKPPIAMTNKQTQSAISPAAAHCQVSDNYYPETRIVGTVFAYFTDVNQYVQSFEI